MDVGFPPPINIDDPVSGFPTPTQTVPTSPTSETYPANLRLIVFDPISPRAAIPTLVRLAHSGGHGATNPSTPILPPRNLSPGPILAAPPPTRTSNDLFLEGVGIVAGGAGRTSSPTPLSSTPLAPDVNKSPSDAPKREEIAMSILLVFLPR